MAILGTLPEWRLEDQAMVCSLDAGNFAVAPTLVEQSAMPAEEASYARDLTAVD